MTTAVEPSALDRARALKPLIQAHAEFGDHNGHLHHDVVRALKDARLYALLLPAAYGGLELPLLELQQVFDEVAAADGSTGWCLMIGAGSNGFSAWLPPDGARELFAGDSGVVSGGMFSPTGRAEVVDGGYRVSGRWSFGSGSLQSRVLLGNCIVTSNGEPQTNESGTTRTIMTFFPTSSVTIHHRWDVMGLRATGSHDFEVADVFVPERHCTRLFSDPPRQAGPTYRLPFQMLLWLWMAPVPLGIARGALELFRHEEASRPRHGSAALRDHPATQARYAQAHAALHSARAYLRDVSATAWEVACRDEKVSDELFASAGLAARHAAVTAARVTETLYELAGTSALRNGSALQRAFRDAHAAMQHVAFASGVDEHAGRAFLQAGTAATA